VYVPSSFVVEAVPGRSEPLAAWRRAVILRRHRIAPGIRVPEIKRTAGYLRGLRRDGRANMQAGNGNRAVFRQPTHPSIQPRNQRGETSSYRVKGTEANSKRGITRGVGNDSAYQ